MAKSINSKQHQTIDLAISVLESHPTPYTLLLVADLRAGNWIDVVRRKKPDALEYSSADEFRVDYMAFNLLRKFSSFDLPLDKRANAIASFYNTEATCRVANRHMGRLPHYRHRELYLPNYSLETSLEAKLTFARDLIHETLGEFDWNKAHKAFGFSGGATTRLPRRTGHPFYKFSGKPEVSRGAAALAVCDIRSSQLWREWFEARSPDPTTWVTVVQGSRLDTVPKDSETERVICLEPDMNMRMQRGVGKLLKDILRTVGVYLTDQTRNQYLALLGSITGALATVDLKAASDSISLEIVKFLLPLSWYEAICQLRSEYTCINGVWHLLEKVSSMGNGFTFELESLIFWALSKSVLKLDRIEDTRLAIYGDDIVIHNSAVEPLERLLNYAGFEVNSKKTHVEGPFRESCGKHYFYGADVTPFYIDEPVESEDRFYWFLNSYAAWLKRAGLPLTRAYRRALELAKRKFGTLCYVPIDYGFTSGIEVSCQNSRAIWSLRMQAYLFRCLLPVREVHEPNGRSAILAWLDMATDIPSERSMNIPKGNVVYSRFRRKTSQWA